MNTASEKDIIYYSLYEQLVSEMTKLDDSANIPEIERLLVEICKILRISKAVTRLYRNAKEEAEGGGETLCSRDTGEDCVLVHKMKVVTSVMTSATLTAYMAVDEPPLTEEEFQRLDIVMRTTICYLSRRRMRDIVEELAYFDDFGYRNSRSFMSGVMRIAGEGRIGGMAAVHYNLRHFSLINQQAGRRAGDEILRNHFESLAKLIGETGLLCRLGGDNFVALFDGALLDRVLQYLKETKVPYDCSGGGMVTIHCSAGVYCLPEDIVISDAGEILSKIIAAFRVAQYGSKRIIYYDEELLKKKEAMMRIQEMFPAALKREEFQVYYQPKVNIFTGEICGAEALCRWFRDGVLVPPMEFIPVLEQNNDICKLDFYMLEHVCRHLRSWLDDGKKVVRTSVNMSRRHMTDENLLKTIMGIINWYSIPHDLIEIELTETTTDVEFKDLKRVVGGLRESGIYTSIDDFGVGYSSLNLIKGVPWNVLKVDRSFLPITEEEPDSVNNIMFKYVVSMSKEIGLECVVEGVETKQHLDILRENGCELAQGFLFDRPLPHDEFEKRLEDDYRYSVEL